MSYQDDKSIADNEALWRRIPQDQVVKDNSGCWRPSTKAFQNSSEEYHKSIMEPLGYTHEPGMSADIASETTVENMLNGNPTCFLVEFAAGFVREQNQVVIRAALPDDPAHIEVMGKKTKGIKNQFVKNCKWVKSPD